MHYYQTEFLSVINGEPLLAKLTFSRRLRSDDNSV